MENSSDITKLKDKERYQEKRSEVIGWLGGKCAKCGSLSDLEIDHIDHNEKSFDISKMIKMTIDRLAPELVKCQVLCEKCHKYKSIIESGKIPLSEDRHGTISMYTGGKCRCDLCKKEHLRHITERRKKLGLAVGSKPRTGLVHGTANAYAYYKCRCDTCKKNHNLRTIERRHNKCGADRSAYVPAFQAG